MMLPARWSKIIKDIWGNKSRSLLVILSIAVGVGAVGMINNAARIIQRDLYADYNAGNPALLEIYVSPFQDTLAVSVEAMREVDIADARRIVAGTISPPGAEPENINLNVTSDFSDINVSRFSLESGSLTPGLREILLERQSADLLGLEVGDQVVIEMPNEREYSLLVSGIVHDVYVMPFSLLRDATGYISMNTLAWMGAAPYYNRLDIVVSENIKTKDTVIAIGNLARDRVIEPSGHVVGRIQVPGIGSEPGQHWAHTQIQGLVLILKIMGIMIMFLSGGLVVNTVSAILVQQIKQIGILRSVGAVRRQVVGMYMFNVLVFSLIGLVIAIPLGLLGAWWLVDFAANFLNYDVGVIDLSMNVFLLQVALALLVPLAVALIPILSGTRISVHDAIYEHGLARQGQIGKFERMLIRIRNLNPPVMIALRNTFRKKSRLAFTIITLTLAGAMFIASFSTYSSLTSQINEIERYIHYDATINVSPGSNSHTVEREALRVPGVKFAEGWANGTAVLVFSDDRHSEEFEIIGLPYDSGTVNPLLVSGTWLLAEGGGRAVVNEDFLEGVAEVQVGDVIELKVGENKRSIQVAGIVSKHLSGPRIYLDSATFSKFTGRQNQVDTVRVLGDLHGPGSLEQQSIIAEQLEERFTNAGLSSSESRTHDSYFGTFSDTFDIILFVLVIMAGLLAVVGGLGLMGTLGINVLERTREIGVLRAVGAANRSVFQVVVIEGLLVGLISWIMGGLLSGPSSLALASAVISAVLQTEASFQYSLLGLVFWLLIVLIIGVFSSLVPARRAASLRVRDVLDYE